jgi:hypothetical protein
MSELYLVEVISHDALGALPVSRVVDKAILQLAQNAKWKDIASFKKDPRGGFDQMAATLKAEPDPKKAEKLLPPNGKLLPALRGIKSVVMQRAGHAKESQGTVVELRVRSIHPDAGMPDYNDPARTLDSFLLRLLADATPANEVRNRYPKLWEGKVRSRSDDLWDYAMAKPKKVKPLSAMPGEFFETTFSLVTDAAMLAHLKAGDRYSSTAFSDGPAAKYGR